MCLLISDNSVLQSSWISFMRMDSERCLRSRSPIVQHVPASCTDAETAPRISRPDMKDLFVWILVLSNANSIASIEEKLDKPCLTICSANAQVVLYSFMTVVGPVRLSYKQVYQ